MLSDSRLRLDVNTLFTSTFVLTSSLVDSYLSWPLYFACNTCFGGSLIGEVCLPLANVD